ncbi:hypothetical protein D3C80_1966460 [compost metagenome]
MQNIYLKNALPNRALIGHNLTAYRFFAAPLSRIDRADVMARIDGGQKSETTTTAAQPFGNTDLQVMDIALVTTVEHLKNGRLMRRPDVQSPRIGSGLTPKKRRELGHTS